MEQPSVVASSEALTKLLGESLLPLSVKYSNTECDFKTKLIRRLHHPISGFLEGKGRMYLFG